MLVIRIAVVDDGDATARVDAAMPAKLIILWFIVRRQQQQPPAMQSHASQARDVMWCARWWIAYHTLACSLTPHADTDEWIFDAAAILDGLASGTCWLWRHRCSNSATSLARLPRHFIDNHALTLSRARDNKIRLDRLSELSSHQPKISWYDWCRTWVSVQCKATTTECATNITRSDTVHWT